MMNTVSAASRSGIGLTREFLNVKHQPAYAYSSDGNVLPHIFIENRQGIYRATMEARIMASIGGIEIELIHRRCVLCQGVYSTIY